MMRYAMNLIGEAHSPMNNINRYSSKNTHGDNNGKLHKISVSSSIKDFLCLTGLCNLYNISNVQATSNLHDYWGNSMGLFGTITYPLQSTTKVATFADSIMAIHTRVTLKSELADVSKKSWSDKAFGIAQTFAYTVADGTAPSASYVSQGKDTIKKQLALAAYRIVDQIIYCMKAQKPRAPRLDEVKT